MLIKNNQNSMRLSIWFCILMASFSHGYRDNSKFLGNDFSEDRHFGNRRRPSNQGSTPCNFGGGYGKPKNQESGRTFFDLQYFNVEHNYNVNIDCGSHGGGGSYPVHPAPVAEVHPIAGDHKPLPGLGGQFGGIKPHHKPGKPGGGGGGGPFSNHGNGGGWFQGLFGGGNNNKPLQGSPFRPGGSGEEGSHHNPGASSGVYSGAFAGIFPSPQQFANGFSDGIQSFIGTIPAIGQSFQSILPSFGDFQFPQLPQFNPGANTGPVTFAPLFQGGSNSFSNPFNRPPPVSAPVATTPTIVTSAPLTTTTDPDDVIYSDELKPVHEDYDPITDPYSGANKPPAGNLRPGQYLVVSNPHLGSYVHDVGAFNPTNLYNKWQQGVQGALEEFGSYF